MPDHSHITELLDETHKKTQDLSFLIDQAHTLTIQMKLATNWMTRLYQNGAELVNFTMEQSSATMGTTAAATTTTRRMTLRLPCLHPTVIAALDTTREPMKAITMTTKHQTLQTYTVTKSTITLIRYLSWYMNLKRS